MTIPVKHLIVVATTLAFPGCYLSQGPSDPEASNDSPDGEYNGTELRDRGMGIEGFDEEANDLDPVLFDADSNPGCTNTDQWLTLTGAGIDWRSSISVTYPFSGATAEIPGDSPRLDWRDLTETAFRTMSDLPWVPAQTNPDSWPSGNYLIHVTNPNGNVSNDVALRLQHCSEGPQRMQGDAIR